MTETVLDPQNLECAINEAWDRRDRLSPSSGGEERAAVEAALEALDAGRLRVAEKTAEGW